MNQNQSNKRSVLSYWEQVDNGNFDRDNFLSNILISPDVRWFGPQPIGTITGARALLTDFWKPLFHSFPDLNRQTHLFFGGDSSGRRDGSPDGREWITGTGLFHATFEKDYLSIPATGKQVNIRWGEFCRMENRQIVEIYFLLDLVDLMQQAGFQVLPESRGSDGLYPPPKEQDGVLLEPQDETETRTSLQHIRRFIFDGLNRYDQSELQSMGMADFFHPDVQWYGPGGIGACLGLQEFEELHQQPWLTAFPDRQVQNLTALIAEGSYSGGPGWAGVLATHTGNYLGCQPTGNRLEINGLDWWKRVDEQYVENWVFVDMVHLFHQFGIDLFKRMTDQINRE